MLPHALMLAATVMVEASPVGPPLLLQAASEPVPSAAATMAAAIRTFILFAPVVIAQRQHQNEYHCQMKQGARLVTSGRDRRGTCAVATAASTAIRTATPRPRPTLP